MDAASHRDEYNNTIRDLFGVDGLTPADPFPMDDALHGSTTSPKGSPFRRCTSQPG